MTLKKSSPTRDRISGLFLRTNILEVHAMKMDYVDITPVSVQRPNGAYDSFGHGVIIGRNTYMNNNIYGALFDTLMTTRAVSPDIGSMAGGYAQLGIVFPSAKRINKLRYHTTGYGYPKNFVIEAYASGGGWITLYSGYNTVNYKSSFDVVFENTSKYTHYRLRATTAWNNANRIESYEMRWFEGIPAKFVCYGELGSLKQTDSKFASIKKTVVSHEKTQRKMNTRNIII